LERAASISDGDFLFIGNSSELRCSKFQAAFISSRVHRLLEEDKTMDSFFVEYEARKVSETRIFEFLGELMNGLPVNSEDYEVDAFVEVAAFLGNSELLDQFVHNGTPIDPSTVCRLWRTKTVLGRSADDEIEFAASHFCELDAEVLREMDVSILERIVSSESLRLKCEDSFLELIFILEREDQIVLVRYLWSEYLISQGMNLLLERLGNSIHDLFVWDSLCARLRLPVSPGHSSIAASRFVLPSRSNFEFPMKIAKSFEGIIWHLTEKHGGNVHDKGIVAMTSKSVWDNNPKYPPKQAVDLTSELFFESTNAPGQWICWDFHEMRFRPTNYTIRTRFGKSYIVVGSIDGENWTTIVVK
jgi:hypothetical protein